MTNIRSFLGAAGVAAVAALGMSTAALAADEGDKFGYSITISGTSDYLFRGISLTENQPAFQPFIEFTYGNPNLTWYFDLWGSNVHATANKKLDPFELDLYAGVRPVTGPVSWDLGVLYYSYPAAPVRGGDYVEFKLAATITPITNLTVTGIGYITPDQGGNSPLTETGELDLAYTLPQVGIFVPTLSGAVGYTNAPGGSGWFYGADNYWYWNAGVKLTVDKYFMDFRYWDTSISNSETTAAGVDHSIVDSRFLFTAGVNLP